MSSHVVLFRLPISCAFHFSLLHAPLARYAQLSQVVEIEIERPANGQAATFGKTAALLRSRTAKTRTDSEGMPGDGLLMWILHEI